MAWEQSGAFYLRNSVGFYPLHLTEVLASLDFYSIGVATHHTCALPTILQKLKSKVPNSRTFIIFARKQQKLVERIFAKSTLRKYWEKHADVEQYLKTWYDTAMSCDWKDPNDVKNTYANASILKDSRVVFNIKGNSYRLVTKFNFEKQWIFIRFIGTHAEYDKIDANTI